MEDLWIGAAPPELLSVLSAIEEATAATPDGGSRQRYSPAGVAGLRRLVVSWNINPRLLDLAYLVAAVEQSGTDAVSFFLSSQHSFLGRDGFRCAMTEVCSHPRHIVDERGLVSRFEDAERITWWNRDILILPPLFELLLTVDGSPIRDCAALRDKGRAADVAATASRWQKLLYAWLAGLVGAEQGQERPLAPLTQQRARRFGKLVKWLRTNTDEPNAPLLERLTDDAILRYWLAQQGDAPPHEGTDDTGHRTFERVAELALHLANAAWAGRARREQLEDPQEGLDATDAALDYEPQSPLRRLQAPPLAAVKFLKDTEMRLVAPLLNGGGAAVRLPLTLLRTQIFGARQRALGRAMDQPERLSRLMVGDLPSYADCLANFQQVRRRLLLVRDACLHVLLHLRSPSAVARVREALPELPCWQDIAAKLPAAAGEREWANEEQLLSDHAALFFRRLPTERLRLPLLAELLLRASNAFAQVHTKGFGTLPSADAQIGGEPAADVYAAGDGCLADIVAAVDGFEATLRQRFGPEGPQEQYRADLLLFRNAFANFYGGQAGQPAADTSRGGGAHDG